jgi:hypothetical protein
MKTYKRYSLGFKEQALVKVYSRRALRRFNLYDIFA